MNNNLDSLNIRKGLELEVDVADIFAINISASGDILTKEICDLGWDVYSTINPELSKRAIEGGGLMYTSQKIPVKISDSLIAYVYDSYLIDASGELESDNVEVLIDVSKEIEFLNTKILDFDQFCINVMQAQSFTGKYKIPIFKFSFYGYGNFSINNYVEVHKMVVLSNIHTLNFFIEYKNVISGISCFLNGLHRNDIIRQREYLTSKEYASLLNEAEMQYEIISTITNSKFE
jgi:hypothetical protein